MFLKYFPGQSFIPQQGFFCNNANAAIIKVAWAQHRFDEDVTGLEDMVLAKQLWLAGEKIGYVADAVVEHIHEERWAQVKRRYEREAIALQGIMPEVHVGFADFLRSSISAIFFFSVVVLLERRLWRRFNEILLISEEHYV